MPAGKPAPSGDAIAAVIEERRSLEGPLLPILHALQETFAHVPPAALPMIADALNISRAEVYGVMTFYHDFRAAPAGRHVLKICRAEACQSVGGAAFAEAALARLGVDWHGTTPDGALTVEPVYCLGLCACGPSVMVDERVHGRVDAERLDAILTEAGL